jgi:hypothetical protein
MNKTFEFHDYFFRILNCFDINETRVVSRKVVNIKGEFLRSEKFIQIPENARFLDLEHEVGHVKQLQENLSGVIQYTEKMLERENRTQKVIEDNQPNSDVLTDCQNNITEYHNRLIEVVKLSERVDSPPTPEQLKVLKEHSQELSTWAKTYKESLRYTESKESKFARKYFPELSELTVKVFQIIKDLGL